MKRLPLISILALSLLLLSCGKENTEQPQRKEAKVNVRTTTIQTARLVDAIQVTGIVKAVDDASISPEEGGVVKEWKARKGQAVNKGDVIIILKDEVLKAGYEAAEAQWKMAELNMDKQQKVYEQNGISELQFKNLVYSRDAAKANFDLMKARYERTRIKSPIDGVVDNIIPNVGEFAPPGMPVARVVNISTVKIQAEVPEKFSGSISRGIKATITLDAIPDFTMQGTVSFVGSTVSAANRTLVVEIMLNNATKRLKPEMVAKVTLVRGTKNNAILVDEGIVQLVEKDRRVVFVESGGKAVERIVEIGGRQENMVEILSGLKAGDRLIVSGFQKLTNGSPVTITNSAE